MIDEDVVMVDVQQQSFDRDDDFDLGKARRSVCVYVHAHITHTLLHLQGRQQRPTSLCLSFSFPLLFHLPPSLWQQAWSHLSNPTTNTHMHSAGAHSPFQSYKDFLLWEWECIF